MLKYIEIRINYMTFAQLRLYQNRFRLGKFRLGTVVYVTLGQLRFSTAIFQVFLGAKIDKEKVVSTESDQFTTYRKRSQILSGYSAFRNEITLKTLLNSRP